MNGEELYLVYTESLLDNGIGIDPWHDLTDADRNAWEAVAVAATAVPERCCGLQQN